MTIDADMQAEFAKLGARVPLTAIGEDVLEVWDINWDALIVFLALATQWRIVVIDNRAFRVGLDYSAAEVVLRIKKIHRKRKVFADLQAMEQAAIGAFSETSA